MRGRGAGTVVLMVLAAMAADTCVAQAQAQEGMPSARRLASMKAEYKRPPLQPAANPALVDLGRNLFWDPRASASGKTSCASCHFPHLGWATSDAKSRNDSGRLTSRRSQTIIAVGHAVGPIGWDGRSASLEAQAKSSIATGSMSMSQTETMVRPSTLLHLEPEFSPNPSKHPARFPLELPTFFIKLLTKPGQFVVDPFGGTGTTALAAEMLDRRWLVTEIDPRYAAVVPSRFAAGR